MWNDFILRGGLERSSLKTQIMSPRTLRLDGLWCWGANLAAQTHAAALRWGERGRGAGFAAEAHCWCPASQVGPAGAKSAHISTSEHTLRGFSCLPHASGQLHPASPCHFLRCRSRWARDGGRQGRQISRTSLRPPFCQPPCLVCIVPSVGTGSRLQRQGPPR